MWYVISYFVCALVFHTVVCAGIRKNRDMPNFFVFLIALVWPLALLWALAMVLDSLTEYIQSLKGKK